MEQVGTVVDVKDDIAIVAVRRHETCSKCGGCGVAVSGRGDNYIEAQNVVNAVVGQTVKVATDTSNVLKASFVVYIVPMLFLLLGIWLGQVIDGEFGVMARFDIVLGIIFLVGSYLVVRGYDKKMAAGEKPASVIEIIEEPDAGPKDEQC
ncbi:SoxR reducing system RseC family protein [Dethiobacter alkaliphilus]|uniref:Positive regulator of sigma E, RseC/MucC n=1 Tax=Dethiobacter alkaliphilus AHT 1 TaxID=555088 RepID=C0GG18_DETAL|nr:SoxR reducing system RseC family protein [Dethiobacter alkaliphilus]EEG77707.1 positive regulator of sigma E, RseC/MucC [Dethiobacter alkaliphilus AHT 1]